MKNSEITKAKLINLFYDYTRIYKRPAARITFHGKFADLYFGKGTSVLQGLTMEDAYEVLKKYTIEKKVSGGNGYIGRSMSINAKRAYERGLKPLTRITSVDLHQNGFYYPVRFFRWLVHNWNIKPKEMHHTSAACNITAFYDTSVIRYVVKCCNLELLVQIYKGKLTMAQAKQIRKIKYARVRVIDKLLGGKSGNVVNANCVFCDDILFLSSKLCIRADNSGVEILEVFDEPPEEVESGKLEELADDLIKHKTSKYFKYLRKWA